RTRIHKRGMSSPYDEGFSPDETEIGAIRLRPPSRTGTGRVTEGYSRATMVVPRELLNSVVFLGVETPDGFNVNGVAYFVSVPATLVPHKVHVYLVTAGHCVRDRDNLVARLNAPGGGTTIDLVPPGDRWLQLADPAAGEHYVDLAAVRWNPEASA